MIFADQTVTLKDGRACTLRAPRESDAARLIEYLHAISTETNFILLSEGECDYTVEKEAKFIADINADPNRLMIVAEVDGVVAGNCEIRYSARKKLAHRASIGIGLFKEFWGAGIGTAFISALLADARKREGVIQVELEFIEGNARARALYEKMGFRIVGLRPDAFRMPDGRLVAEYLMTVKL